MLWNVNCVALLIRLRRGDQNDFPDLDSRVQVPFVRLVLEACFTGGKVDDAKRRAAINATLDMIERIRQEIAMVDFWKNPEMRELLTKRLVRDLDASGVCSPGKERDLAQKLVALARENHSVLVKK